MKTPATCSAKIFSSGIDFNTAMVKTLVVFVKIRLNHLRMSYAQDLTVKLQYRQDIKTGLLLCNAKGVWLRTRLIVKEPEGIIVNDNLIKGISLGKLMQKHQK